eukprot:3066913-Pleurochrysis_carterae.AAC.1
MPRERGRAKSTRHEIARATVWTRVALILWLCSYGQRCGSEKVWAKEVWLREIKRQKVSF